MIEHIKRHSRTVMSYGSVAIAASALGAAARPLLQVPMPTGSDQRIEYRLAEVGPGGGTDGPMGGGPGGGSPGGPMGDGPPPGMPGGMPGGMMGDHGPGSEGGMRDGGSGPRGDMRMPGGPGPEMGREDMMGRPGMGDRGSMMGEGDRRGSGDMMGDHGPGGPMGGPGPRGDMRGGPGMEGDMMRPEGRMDERGMRDRPMMDGNERRGMMDDRGMGERGGDQGRGSGGMMNEEQQKQWEEMEKKQQEERKVMETKQLEQIKRGLAQAKRGLASMKKMFDKAAAKGTPIPADCQAALKSAEETLAAADKATTIDEMQDANAEDLRDHFETLNECRMTVERIVRAQQVVKRVDRDVKSLERRWNRAKRSPTAEMQESLSEGEGIWKQIKEKRASLDGLLKEGKVDDFEDTLEDEIYGRFDDLDTVMRHLEAIRNSKRFVKEYSKRMRQAEQMIAKLKRIKQDTSALEELLVKAKAQYDTLKTLKPGTDEFDEALKELFDIEQEFAVEFHGDQDFSSELEARPSPSQKQDELRLEF